MGEGSLIGQKIPRIDSVELVTGAGQFSGDVVLPGMLHGRILRSTIAHGRILNIDVSRAKRLHGVRAILTGRDIPQKVYGAGSGGAPVPGAIPDEQILCVEKVRYAGDPIAAVAAVDRDTAEEALQLIQASYQAGIANYLQVLIANGQYHQAKIGYLQALAQRFQDTVALFVALGGGWWDVEEKILHNS